jgi:3-isopropylmalate/(R)-2-methylmalate dehydratase small subunit
MTGNPTMNHLPQFASRVAPLLVNDIDTDQIIPARFLKVTDKTGLGGYLFADWRFHSDGSPKPEFVLNLPKHRGAAILLAGSNFGCGSSREHAPWALVGYGFRAVISTSFADIFRNNALKNSLLPITVESSVHHKLSELAQNDPSAELSVDLESQTLRFPDGGTVRFPIDSFSKSCLLNGTDELGYLLRFEKQIEEYEKKRLGGGE